MNSTIIDVPPNLHDVFVRESLSSSAYVSGETIHGREFNSKRALEYSRAFIQAQKLNASGLEDSSEVIAGIQDRFASIPSVAFSSSPVSESIRAVERLRTFKDWNDNWDAEGAPAPRADAVESAVLLVGFLAPVGARTRVNLDAFGRPLILISNQDAEAEITVIDNDTLEFAVLGDEDGGEVDVHFDGLGLPSSLKAALSAAGIAVA